MNIEIKTKMVVETTAFSHQGMLKTHPCELYAWYGESTCKKVDFNSAIEEIVIPEGEYKITITLEKV